MNHTPGPWIVSVSPYSHVIAKKYSFNPALAIFEHWSSIDEANAQLMAAAPDLLEVCEAIAEWMDEPAPPWNTPEEAERAWELSKQVDAAIARARGEA